jgi:hypothetical protein
VSDDAEMELQFAASHMGTPYQIVASPERSCLSNSDQSSLGYKERNCGMLSAEDMPEESQVDGNGAEHSADEPLDPEQPSPAGAQCGQNRYREESEQEWERSEIGVVGSLAQFADAVCDIEQQGDAKRRRKEYEQPGADYAPARELEDSAGDEKNDCEPAEETFHRMPPATVAPGLNDK